MSQKDQIEEITNKLKEGIEKLFNSERYKDFLTTMSKFTNYSFNNNLLISMQCPGATYVASYKSWEANFDRHVNKGEHGIKILAPAPYKVDREQEKRDVNGQLMYGKNGEPLTEKVQVTIPAFKQIYVYDVSQTSGSPLPEICNKLNGDVDGYDNFKEALERISPVPVSYEPINTGANGYFSVADNKIVVQNDMSQEQTCKTLLHEITHSILHSSSADKEIAPDRKTKEVQAESVAYTICQRYGIDSSEYSFGYLAGWSSGKDMKELQASMELIRQTARDMISSIDKELDSIHMERTNQLAYKLDNGYLLIDRTSSGYDCCLLDKDYKELSVNKIDGAKKRIDYAADAYLKSKDISIVKHECAYYPVLAERDVQHEAQSISHFHGR